MGRQLFVNNWGGGNLSQSATGRRGAIRDKQCFLPSLRFLTLAPCQQGASAAGRLEHAGGKCCHDLNCVILCTDCAWRSYLWQKHRQDRLNLQSCLPHRHPPTVHNQSFHRHRTRTHIHCICGCHLPKLKKMEEHINFPGIPLDCLSLFPGCWNLASRIPNWNVQSGAIPTGSNRPKLPQMNILKWIYWEYTDYLSPRLSWTA